MIRNVVMGRLHPDADRDLLARGLAGIVALEIEGLVSIRAGADAGLREGNWDYAIVGDFADEASYHRYDLDEEHNRLRAEVFRVVSEQIVRVQFEL